MGANHVERCGGGQNADAGAQKSPRTIGGPRFWTYDGSKRGQVEVRAG